MLPNKTGVVKKREIPVDKPLPLPTEPKKTEPIDVKKHLIKFVKTQPTELVEKDKPEVTKTKPAKPIEPKPTESTTPKIEKQQLNLRLLKSLKSNLPKQKRKSKQLQRCC